MINSKNVQRYICGEDLLINHSPLKRSKLIYHHLRKCPIELKGPKLSI